MHMNTMHEQWRAGVRLRKELEDFCAELETTILLVSDETLERNLLEVRDRLLEILKETSRS